MDAISDLSKQLAAAYSDITFIEGDEFMWSPTKRTVTFNSSEPSGSALLLHELGHAVLGHANYSRDVELIAMEVDAWQQARTLASTYSVTLNEDHIEDHLDTYREWLHARSLCPQCNATGLQSNTRQYRCLACTHEWRVNEARICALRRYNV